MFLWNCGNFSFVNGYGLYNDLSDRKRVRVLRRKGERERKRVSFFDIKRESFFLDFMGFVRYFVLVYLGGHLVILRINEFF